MVAPSEFYEGDTNVVRRVRKWLEEVEAEKRAAGSSPRLCDSRRPLDPQRGIARWRIRALREDVALLGRRLERLRAYYPDFGSIGLSEALEEAAGRLSAEVT